MCQQRETTVRRQAREAVWTVPDDHPDLPNPNVYADIVSDVWEPLLREVWGMADGSIPMDRHRLIEIKMALAHDPKED